MGAVLFNEGRADLDRAGGAARDARLPRGHPRIRDQLRGGRGPRCATRRRRGHPGHALPAARSRRSGRRSAFSPRPTPAVPTGSSSSARTSTPSRKARASTTTARAPRRSWRSPSSWPTSDDERRPLRLLRGGGGRAAGCGALRRRPHCPGAQGHRAEPELRHAGQPELRAVHLRRRSGSATGTPSPRTVRATSRTSSPSTSRARGSTRRRRRSTAAATTGRSSPPASRPADCSPVPRTSGPRSRPAPTSSAEAANVAYDECYHSACDDITNVNEIGLDQLAVLLVLRTQCSRLRAQRRRAR